MNTSNPEPVEIEELLSAAGIEFAVVERCPHPACDVCVGEAVPAAA